MKKEIHKCAKCGRIIGVEIFPGNEDKDEVVERLECIKCYNKQNWENI